MIVMTAAQKIQDSGVASGMKGLRILPHPLSRAANATRIHISNL